MFEKYGASAISLKKFPLEKVERYSIIKGKRLEKPLTHQAPSNLAIMGRYVLTQDIFDKLNETKLVLAGKFNLLMH